MKFFSLFADGKIKPAWKFQTSGNLWRFLFSDTGRIVGEDRDQDRKTVTFFCLNETTGGVLWKDVKLEESWWIGIETVHNGVVYLHGFVKPDLPQHQKIIALDIETGTLLWRHDDLQFFTIADGKLFASRDSFEKRVFFQLDTGTGEIQNEFSEQDGVNLTRGYQGASDEEFEFPRPLTQDVENFGSIEEMLRSQCDLARITGDVEFIHRGNLLFFNYHQRAKSASIEKPFLENHLKVIDAHGGRLIFSDSLNEKVLNPTPDSFFVKGDHLFYVRNKNTLVAVRLEELQRKM